MAKKVLVTWDIRSKRERELVFIRLRELATKLHTLGLELEDAWYTVYGDSPQILLGIVAHNRKNEKLQSALTSPEWEQLWSDLKQHIKGFQQRIVEGAGRFCI